MDRVHFLRLNKCGGTAFFAMMKGHQKSGNARLLLHGEDSNIGRVPKGEKIVVSIREPLDRFVSGFYDRKRDGAPAYQNPLQPWLKVHLDKFETPNALAEALSSESELNASARELMFGVGHFFQVYAGTFWGANVVRSRRDDFLSIIRHETMGEDVARFLIQMEMPPGIELPTGDEAHVAPKGEDRALSALAMHNLSNWYSADIRIYNELILIAGEMEQGQ